MLQRIQTLYLFIAAVVAAALLKIPLLSLKTETEVFIVNYNGVFDFATNENILINIVGIVLYITLIAAPLITILFFKKRKLQIKLSNYCIILNLLFILDIAYFVYQVQNQMNVSLHYELGLLFPVISIIILILAKKNIRKDEELIRSVDRIR